MSFIKYKLVKDPITAEQNVVNKILTGRSLSIPFDPANTDYQEYLKWKAEGGVPEAADPGPSDWDIVREKRDRLLKDSDWAMTTGATIDQAQWSAYREKLRDIPQTYKNVSDPLTEVVWPTAPSSKGPNS